ncbi:proteoglycan 4 isoform X3 [Danio aesculapii]|uniref:proteoglycan 4 isoform X3 n=1 Tax=Danio aesculapii TaxID=1142201 RepID=UPI0024BFC920|nr:proteoglycan 4 isoform X3 [Danio aesculapii]
MDSGQSPSTSKIICALCKTSDETETTGPLSSKEDISAHQNCLLFSSNIYCKNSPIYDDLFGFDLEDVKKEQRRGKKLRCYFCNKSGATVGCEIKRCQRSFHYPCAIKADARAVEDVSTETYRVYCKSHDPKPIEINDEIDDDVDPVVAPVEKHVLPEQHNQSTPDPERTRLSEEVNTPAKGSSTRGLTSDQRSCGTADKRRECDSPEHTLELKTPTRRKKIRRLEYPDDENPTSADAVMAPEVSAPEESMTVNQPDHSTPVPENRRSCEKFNPSTTGADDDDDADETDIESVSQSVLNKTHFRHIEESRSVLTSELDTMPCIVIVDSGPSLESDISLGSCSPKSPGPAIESDTVPKQEKKTPAKSASPAPKALTTKTFTPQDPAPNQKCVSDGPSVSPQHSSPTAGLRISSVCTLARSAIKKERLPDPPTEVGTSDSENSVPNCPSGAAKFWMRCNQAGWTEGIFSELMSLLCSLGQRVQSEQASDQDYDLALEVLKGSGQLPSIIARVEKDLERQEQDLQMKKAALRVAKAALRD